MFEIVRVFAEGEAPDVNGGAASTAASTGGFTELLVSLLPMVLIFVLLYFIMIRPQRKREKELRAKIEAMKVGDKVVTIGGLCGKVIKIKDEFVFIETGNIGTPDERSVLKFERTAIKSVDSSAQ